MTGGEVDMTGGEVGRLAKCRSFQVCQSGIMPNNIGILCNAPKVAPQIWMWANSPILIQPVIRRYAQIWDATQKETNHAG